MVGAEERGWDVRAKVEGKLISAVTNGKWVNVEAIVGGRGQRMFTALDEPVASKLLGMGELQPFEADVDVFASSRGAGNGSSLSVRVVEVRPVKS